MREPLPAVTGVGAPQMWEAIRTRGGVCPRCFCVGFRCGGDVQALLPGGVGAHRSLTLR